MSIKTKVKYPIAMKWKIPETELQELRNSIDGCLKSARRAIAGTDVKYYLSIDLNGHDEETRGQTWIYFHLYYKENKEIESEYTLSVESADFSEDGSDIFKKSLGYGTLLCKTEELFEPKNGFIVDGELIVNLDGFLMIEKNVPAKSNQLSKNGDSFGVTLWNQETKDFTIVADDKEITAHKIILLTRSPVFAAMFQPHTQEAQQNKVIIPDFSFDVVETAIKLCYDSSLVENISLEDMISLLQFYDKYDIEPLKEKVEEYLISELNETNVCSLYNCSSLPNAPKLRKKCTEFLQHCLHARKPVADLDLLDNDLVVDLFKRAFHPIV